MKYLKVILIIGMIVVALICLAGCDAQYHFEDSDWSVGTDGTVWYQFEGSNLSVGSDGTLQYHPEESDWSFGTDGSIWYRPEGNHWQIKIW